jgi:hypothetical protein
VVAKVGEGLAVNKQRSHTFHMEMFNLKMLNEVEGIEQCCPTFLCTRAQFIDAYGGAGATTLLLLLLLLVVVVVVVVPLNTYYYYHYYYYYY